MKTDPKVLAQILSEEFERDHWGDIDPFLFEAVTDGPDPDEEHFEDAKALADVLARVCERLGERCDRCGQTLDACDSTTMCDADGTAAERAPTTETAHVGTSRAGKSRRKAKKLPLDERQSAASDARGVANELLTQLSLAESCETEADFDANVADALDAAESVAEMLKRIGDEREE